MEPILNVRHQTEEDLESYDLEKYSFGSSTLIIADKKSVTIKRNGEQRLPTRKPDPKIYNRNAVNARENRRKKKLYLETLEKELQYARSANDTLSKALKRQMAISRQLEKQKKYYQNIIANHTEISSLLSILSNKKTPCSGGQEEAESKCSSAAETTDDIMDNDFDNCGCFESCSDLSSIWDKDSCLAGAQDVGQQEDKQSVFEDHCYYATSSSSDIHSSPELSTFSTDLSWDDDIGGLTTAHGQCLHVKRGKEEFCPTCHFDLSPSPPLQLFSSEIQ
ncbi:uncharacterized protein LOC106096398 isoform X1 [Stomoxys calcitrans]|uniref:uncharacterized protein LOC106096398 isoform X1 n=1 Tax=Stomoxys calcitrans TaxID=35570 RepID=UPI0027E28D79|nr:uncharacterized protein LOC106096398 isoform X1 [Stomoxys calcitrans]